MAIVIGAGTLPGPQPAWAKAGVYGVLRTGAVVPSDMNYAKAINSDLLLDLGTGWTVGGAIGYRFNQPLRAELSFDYLDASLKGTYRENGFFVPCGTFANQPCLGPAVNGGLKAWSGFAMGYYDIDLSGPVSPYIGAGLGLVRMGLDVKTTARLNVGTSRPFAIVDDRDAVLGYRLASGIAFDVGPAKVDVGYTYTRANAPSLDAAGSAIPAFTFDRRLRSHSVTAGIRFGF